MHAPARTARGRRPDGVRALGSIVDQGQRASGIIRRLRSFARREEDDREPLRLSSIVEESIQLISQPRRRAKVQITADFASADDMVVANGVQIQQVVINLLLNAIEALGALDGDRERRIRVSTRIAGTRVARAGFVPSSPRGGENAGLRRGDRGGQWPRGQRRSVATSLRSVLLRVRQGPRARPTDRALDHRIPRGRLWLSAPEDGSSDPPGPVFTSPSRFEGVK